MGRGWQHRQNALPVLVIRGTWSDGSAVPKGDCNHLSPSEWVHAVLFKVASDINADISREALETWRVTLLSTPAVFVRIDANDDAFAEANSLRQEAAGFRRAVEHSSRQLVLQHLEPEASHGGGQQGRQGGLCACLGGLLDSLCPHRGRQRALAQEEQIRRMLDLVQAALLNPRVRSP